MMLMPSARQIRVIKFEAQMLRLIVILLKYSVLPSLPPYHPKSSISPTLYHSEPKFVRASRPYKMKDDQLPEEIAAPPYTEAVSLATEPPPSNSRTYAPLFPTVLPPRETGSTLFFGRLSHALSRSSLRFRHTLNINPGFCPAAFRMRHENHHQPCSKQNFSATQSRILDRCLHCGLRPHRKYPQSYIKGRPTAEYPKYTSTFSFECHISTTMRDNRDQRSCVICWEHKGVWVGPMLVEVWGAHMREHFTIDGYEICLIDGRMANRNQCPAKRCTRIHG